MKRKMTEENFEWDICCTNCHNDTFRAYAKSEDEILRLKCVECGQSYNTKLRPKKPLTAYNVLEIEIPELDGNEP